MATVLSEILRAHLSAHLKASRVGLKQFEDIHGMKEGAFKGFLDPSRQQVPSLDKAHELCQALGYDLRILTPGETVNDDGIWVSIGGGLAVAEAGPDVINISAHRIGHLAFHRDWLKGMQIDPARASLLRCAGLAMRPTLPADAVVLVDHQIKEPNGTELFAFVRGKELLIRRIVYRAGRALTILCDNPQFDPEILTGEELRDIRILGKVRWTGHEAF